MINLLKESYIRLINEVQTITYRYLYSSFDVHRLTGLIGPRGVGKTTLLLQYIKNNLYKDNKTFYFSADHMYFNTNSILNFVDQMYREEGIEIFFIDEIHKYSFGDWSQELKNIYDSFPSVKVVFSGSSSLDLIKGSYDLSRRAKLFHLYGMSFREYYNFKAKQTIQAVKFEELIKNYKAYDAKWSQLPRVMGHFKEYLNFGYYPFLFETNDVLTYYQKVSQIIEKTIYEDIAKFYNLQTSYLSHLGRIISFLATIPPGKITIHNLAKNLQIDDKTIFNYLTMLSTTGLIRLIYGNERGNKLLRKPEKIFLNNSTLLNVISNSLSQSVDMGTLREIFFIQSLENAGIQIFYNDEGDFNSNNLIFEIGGKNKNKKQIKHLGEDGFLVKDNILMSAKNIIPLYYFGFLY